MSLTGALQTLNVEALHEQVYRVIRAALMAGRFPPGEKLIFRSVAKALGVSPSPVRVALGRLVTEQALSVLPSGTVLVPHLTRAKFDELIEMRVMLEGEAARRAAALISEPELDVLARLCRDLTEAAAGGDAETYLQLNKDVKFAIYRATANQTLVSLIESVWLQFGPFMHYYSKNVRFQTEIDRHEQASAALRRRDGDAAGRAIAEDIRYGAEFLARTAEFFEAEAKTQTSGNLVETALANLATLRVSS